MDTIQKKIVRRTTQWNKKKLSTKPITNDENKTQSRHRQQNYKNKVYAILITYKFSHLQTKEESSFKWDKNKSQFAHIQNSTIKVVYTSKTLNNFTLLTFLSKGL